MNEVTIRQLRNDVSRIINRVCAGERLIVTSNGVPVAEIGPLVRTAQQQALDELYASGALILPRSRARPRPATPVVLSGPRTTDQILAEHRADRT